MNVSAVSIPQVDGDSADRNGRVHRKRRLEPFPNSLEIAGPFGARNSPPMSTGAVSISHGYLMAQSAANLIQPLRALEPESFGKLANAARCFPFESRLEFGPHLGGRSVWLGYSAYLRKSRLDRCPIHASQASARQHGSQGTPREKHMRSNTSKRGLIAPVIQDCATDVLTPLSSPSTLAFPPGSASRAYPQIRPESGKG